MRRTVLLRQIAVARKNYAELAPCGLHDLAVALALPAHELDRPHLETVEPSMQLNRQALVDEARRIRRRV
jgi:hypothetical protein